MCLYECLCVVFWDIWDCEYYMDLWWGILGYWRGCDCSLDVVIVGRCCCIVDVEEIEIVFDEVMFVFGSNDCCYWWGIDDVYWDFGLVFGGSERFCGWCDCCGFWGWSVVCGVIENEWSCWDLIFCYIYFLFCFYYWKLSFDYYFYFWIYFCCVYIFLSVVFVVVFFWILFVCFGIKFWFVF